MCLLLFSSVYLTSTITKQPQKGKVGFGSQDEDWDEEGMEEKHEAVDFIASAEEAETYGCWCSVWFLPFIHFGSIAYG